MLKYFLLISFIPACNARRNIEDISSLEPAEIKSIQAEEGVVRQIECVSAQSLVQIDGSDIGISSEVVGDPIEGLAKIRFLSPLTAPNYAKACEMSLDITASLAEAKIAELNAAQSSDSSVSFDSKEETAGSSEADRWVPEEQYERIERDGLCACRDIKAKKLDRPIFCTQKFRFNLNTGNRNNNQSCIGFHTVALENQNLKDLANSVTKSFCKSKTKSWAQTCKKQQAIYRESFYFKANGFRPDVCKLPNDTATPTCVCETDPKPMKTIQGQRFFCQKGSEENAKMLDITNASGQEILEEDD